MKRSELLKSREYWLAEIQLNLFNLIENYRSKKKINKTQLAAELGVTKGYVTQILNGDFDHKISKLVDLSLSFNKVPIITYLDLDKYVEDDAENKPHYLDNRHLPKVIQYQFYVNGGEVFTTKADFNKKGSLSSFSAVIDLQMTTSFPVTKHK